MPLAVELRDVSFAYPGGPPVLRDVDLAVEAGEFVAVAGPNGGGKTTLLRVLLGLERPTNGTALLFGEPAAHLGGKDLSMWTSAYPSGFQPYRKSHTNLDLWALAGYDKKYIGSYMDSQSTSYNHPNSAIEPRIPGIFQYYSVAEDELQKTFAGKGTAQQGADNIAAAWEKLTDKLGRENQIKYYRISMGI